MKKIFKFDLKRLIISLSLSAIYLIFALISLKWAPLEQLDNKIMDGIYQHEDTAAPEIIIVGIDEETIATYDAYNPIEYRQYFADILNKWAAHGDRLTIGFDVIFNKTYGCDIVDQNLALAMAKHDVILGVNGMSRKEAPYGLSETIYNSAKDIGFCDAVTDSDEAIRRVYLRGDNYDSLSYTLYRTYSERKNLDYLKVDIKKDYYFKYYSSPQINYVNDTVSLTSGFNYYSMKDAIEGDIQFRSNSIIIFGSYSAATDTGLSNDIYNSPIGEMFGVETQCNIIQSLLEGELYVKVPNYASIIINTILVLIITFLMATLTFYLGFLAFGLGIGMEFALMAIFYSLKQYYFISLPILVIILSFVFFIVLHYYSEYKHKKEVIGTFKRYISPDVAEALVEKDKTAMALGGIKRNVALLFVDIRGFTKMSEELDPEKVVDILNGYLEMSTNQVFRFGGMVDKFIGDCVMAIFNAPIDLDDYVYKAVCAAYGIVQVGKKICDQVAEKYNKKLEFGVGVHFGDAVIGNIGSKTRMDYTAIGDTVNTASRIEASASGNQVLISSDVYEVLKDRVKVIDAGDRQFKNKKEPIKCYEVVSIDGYIDE